MPTRVPDPSSPASGPTVRLIGRSEFLPPPDVAFSTDADGGQALAEFAGRACYQSFDKPRAATATNAGFLAHILQVGHLSVLEHATATFYLTGISRGLTHELLRHRHLSVSELSPRHLPEAGLPAVVPAAVAADPALARAFGRAVSTAQQAQRELLDALQDNSSGLGIDGRQARQLAQGVVPAAAATAAVATGNLRAWRHFIGVRGTDSADLEIRAVAMKILELLIDHVPHAVADFRISALPDGTRMAASPLVGEG